LSKNNFPTNFQTFQRRSLRASPSATPWEAFLRRHNAAAPGCRIMHERRMGADQGPI
jgi:hypothetical protein